MMGAALGITIGGASGNSAKPDIPCSSPPRAPAGPRRPGAAVQPRLRGCQPTAPPPTLALMPAPCSARLALLTLATLTACSDDPKVTTGLPAADPTAATFDPSDSDSDDAPTNPTTTGPSTGEPTTDPGTGETGPPDMACAGIAVPAIDESACGPLASDYQPRDASSANDAWPACVTDTTPYPQVNGGTPGSAARIDAYVAMAALLWANPGEPTPADFTAARDQYVIPEGLESRLVRREDLHVPGIPMDEWDDQVDGDKQCTVQALADKYPDRCVGPFTLKPIADAAFVAGQSGDGDPRVHAAELHAALDWFLWLSIYTEAETCGSEDPGDCDSCWAYYTGLEPMSSGKAFSRDVLDVSQNTHERIWDGIRAVRCWRDLYSENGEYPLFPALDADAHAQFDLGWEQLDQALHRGIALVVRAHTTEYLDTLCGAADVHLPAAWAYLQILGPALQHEADARDPATAATLADLWSADEPSPQQLADGITAIDAIFSCP